MGGSYTNIDTPGPQGPEGKSAYQVWLEEGNIGTEQDFFDFLIGPQGINGIDGKTILYGSGVPDTEGSDGDFYIDISTNTLFGPKSNGMWSPGISLIGPQGPQGLQGNPGSPGEPGQDGAPGINGTNGLDGKSAYQVALANGFSGTEAAWIASLEGPQGIQGLQGDTGPEGPQGIQGVSPFVQSGNNAYYNTGNIGINNSNPIKPLHIGSGSDAIESPSADLLINNNGRADIVLRNSTGNIEFSLTAGDTSCFFIARGTANMTFLAQGGFVSFDAGSGTDELVVTNGKVDINGNFETSGTIEYNTQGGTATSLVGRDSSGRLTTTGVNDLSNVWTQSGSTIKYDAGNVGVGGDASSIASMRILRGGSVPKSWSEATYYANTPLVIERNDNAYATFLGRSDKTSGWIFADEDRWQCGSMIYKHATDMLVFRADGIEILWLRNGNIGIKTDNPTEPLHVAGNGKITGTLEYGVQGGTATSLVGRDSVGKLTTVGVEDLLPQTVVLGANITASMTLNSTHENKYITVNSATPVSITIPSGTYSTSDQIVLEQTGAGKITVVAGAGMTLNGGLDSIDQYKILTIFFKSATVATVIGGE